MMAGGGSLNIIPNGNIEIVIHELGLIARFSKTLAEFAVPSSEVARSTEFQYVSMTEPEEGNGPPQRKFVLKLSSSWKPPSMEDFYNK